jgi:hypothetical protein
MKQAASKARGLQKRELYTVFTVQAYQTSQYVVPRGGIFLGKWRSSFAGSSDGKMTVQSACALNTRYIEAGGSLDVSPSTPTGSSKNQRKPTGDRIVATRRYIPEDRSNLTK